MSTISISVRSSRAPLDTLNSRSPRRVLLSRWRSLWASRSLISVSSRCKAANSARRPRSRGSRRADLWCVRAASDPKLRGARRPSRLRPERSPTSDAETTQTHRSSTSTTAAEAAAAPARSRWRSGSARTGRLVVLPAFVWRVNMSRENLRGCICTRRRTVWWKVLIFPRSRCSWAVAVSYTHLTLPTTPYV